MSQNPENNSLLYYLCLDEVWEAFYAYKTSLICQKSFAKELRNYIDSKAYLPVCDKIIKGEGLSIPKKSVISKMSTRKKRVVYTYPYEENMVLKILTWLVLREYDDRFSDGLFSFRPGKTAKLAVNRLFSAANVKNMHTYKLDVSNYFNSISVEKMIEKLENMVEDRMLLDFFKNILTQPYVLENGHLKEEQKGIMAGTPIASFFANVYLDELDKYYAGLENAGNHKILYSRYSDDIIILCEDREKLDKEAENIKQYLKDNALSINPDKEEYFTPEEGFVFLGFSYEKGVVDIAPATVTKLKGKMRRKMRALMRWGARNEVDPERSAKAFIRVFNRKLLESPDDNELSWAYWFFPVINTTKSLKEIDHYAQQCIRTLMTGKHTKARFNARYEEMKKLGYRSLVHEYYKDEYKS